MNAARAQAGFLPNGRLHLNDGPIDLIIEAFGDSGEVGTAYAAAIERFETILDELCSELPLLRAEAGCEQRCPAGAVAQRMFEAVLPYAADSFITPMAAVAGAVAEEVLSSMTSAADLRRAYVNNGGDIAVHLSGGEEFSVGMIDRPDHPSLVGKVKLIASDLVRGLATSGWRGRSFSLGIADAVTVLAERATQADAAATIIANAVDLPRHPGIVRVPACEIAPDSDLGARLVTRGVPQLSAREIDEALAAGLAVSRSLVQRGLICSAALHLQGETRTLDILPGMLIASETSRRLVHA